ncbi:MAG TPA: carboxypeptidase-like regulatory domain-containing protein, partial [Candidatus Paceibacterota bacterium]|nr:carboxypeptidase-like regulatory domain-containing protein [Candidatus Paceibacterota bacterium]
MSAAARADDHGVALAYPVDGSSIRIDGDLSDWPAHLPRYGIRTHFYGAEPDDEEDFSAEFRLGYDAATNALYVALEVQDANRGKVVIPIESGTNDFAAVWVRLPSAEEPPRPPVGFGASLGPPTASTMITTFGPWYINFELPVHFVVATARQGDQWRCEYRIDIASLTQHRHRLAPGQMIELNFSLFGGDGFAGGVENESIAWLAPGVPHQQDGRGDVLLVDSDVSLGRIAGQVRLWDGQPPGTVKKVRIQSESAPERVVHARTDPDGHFEVQLPVGRYRVAVDQRGWESRTSQVVVVAIETVAQVNLTAPPVTGRVSRLGEGRAQSAGRGVRQGAWLSYGVAEGLPRATVLAILQDRRGHLWLGTGGGGLVHFDGARFTMYTREDGLPSDDVAGLVEDGQGNLWMTPSRHCPKGVTRLDPTTKQLLTYDSADGLALDIVGALTVDREGRVWLATQVDPSRW